MPAIERHTSKWETKYYRLGLWLKFLVLFAILTFSLNGGAFCESKSIDVVLKYSSSVKIKNLVMTKVFSMALWTKKREWQ